MDPVLEHAPCGYLLVGDDGLVAEGNATLAELLNRPSPRLAGAHIDRLLTPASRIFYQTHVFPTVKLQGTLQEVYMAFRVDGGGELPVLASIRRRAADERFASDWIVVPMRQRNEYENEILKARRGAEEASRAKEEFLAVVSHELRSPLAGIMGWAQLLQSGKLDPARREKAVNAILRAAKLQAKLVDDILDYGRIFSGKLRIDVDAVDLASTVESAIEGITPAATAKGIRISSLLDRDAGVVGGDASRLEQVFWNILGNAVKFTPRGGRVEVQLARAASSVEVRVSDTGIGISPEFLPHVFERFRQAEGTAGRGDNGLGLGMSIASHIVELHGGTIRAESPGEGQGSCFVVRLPLRLAQDAVVRSPHRLAEASAMAAFEMPGGLPLQGLSLLVVEDEPDARDLLEMILRDNGAIVRMAGTVQEALTAYGSEPPDLLLSDIEMPGGDGYSLVRRIREIENGHGRLTPAIALTGHSRAADRMRALSAGFQMHIPKPVHPAELVVAVANLTAVKR